MFEIGDIVYDPILFPGKKGEIVFFTNDGYMRVNVNGNRINELYTLDGRSPKLSIRTLSRVNYEFKLPPQPPRFKEGDPVLVKQLEGNPWIVGVYCDKNESGNHRVYISNYNSAQSVTYCIPFDKDKVGTYK